MSEVLFENRKFEIEPAAVDDVVGIGEAHLQSWLETYPNASYGVTEEWIRSELGFLVEDGQREDGRDNGIPYRKRLIEVNDPNALYEVVKDETGTVRGFLHVTRGPRQATLDAIYLTNSLKGAGVAAELMTHALNFTGDLPIRLQAVAYNERAIKFYEKYGFVRGELEQELYHGRMPVINMERLPEVSL